MLALVAAFVLAAVTDLASCVWLRWRETGKVWAGVATAMLLETLGWVPILLAIQYQDWRIALACVGGAGVGSAVGLRYRGPGSATRDMDPGRGY